MMTFESTTESIEKKEGKSLICVFSAGTQRSAFRLLTYILVT